jgi:hypothetical protein
MTKKETVEKTIHNQGLELSTRSCQRQGVQYAEVDFGSSPVY